jgi:hypothetical protein
MKRIHSRINRISYSHYLAFFTLFLLLGAIFITITNSLQKQALRSTAATLPPGSVLPSDAECAQQVIKTPENIPDNQTANNTNTAIAGYKLTGSPLGTFGATYEQKVSGNFSGTTDEIIQWGACKWGIDADTARAIAAGLSKWKQSALADCNHQGTIQPETNGCQSVGIMRIKSANIPPTHPGTWPYAKTSTAFNVDYVLGVLRACIDGKETTLGPKYAAGDENGCIGAWYSGAWHDGSAEGFILGVQNLKQTKEWTTYAGTAGGTTPPIISSNPLPPPATNISPTMAGSITPTFFPLAPCPSCVTETGTPTITGISGPTGSTSNPEVTMSNPSPTTDPCVNSDASVASDKGWHGHRGHHGGVSDGMDIILKFFLELITLLLQLLGSGQVNTPNPTPEPTSTPTPSDTPCSPSEVPTSAPIESSTPIPSQMPITTAPSNAPAPSVSPAP